MQEKRYEKKMENADAIKKMYKLFLDNGGLTKRVLEMHEISEKIIEEAIEQGLFKYMDGANILVPTVTNPLKCFIGSFMNEKQTRRDGMKMYEIMLRLDDGYLEAKWHLFNESVRRREFMDSYYYLKKMRSDTEWLPLFEYNFCLFLLNYIIELDAEDKEAVGKMTLEDICPSDDYENDKNLVAAINRIRETVFKGELGIARRNADRASKKCNYAVIPGKTIRSLVNAAQSRQNYLSHHRDIKPKMKVQLNHIAALLRTGNHSYGYSLLHLYLEERGLDEYEYLIVDLVKISKAMGDYGLEEALKTLAELTSGDFKFTMAYYIEGMERTLQIENYIAARSYFDIVVQALNRGHSDMSQDELEIYLLNLKRDLAAQGIDATMHLIIKPMTDKDENKNDE